jgi:tripartite-type tricarboxylate transporter receptor subunit TctC
MVVPFAAGGPADVLARILDQRLSEALGQQVIIENAGGVGGVTGSVHVAKAAPDGYQLVMGTDRRSPEYLARFAAGEIDKWSGPIKVANISTD